MPIDRRAVLSLAFASVAAAAVGTFQYLRLAPPPRRILTAAEKKACGLTVDAVEGPYFVSGMREIPDGNLNATGLEGEPVEVAGRVFDGLSNTPLPGAEVEIWHADSHGKYHPNANGKAASYQAAELALRGFVKTDANGAFLIRTIYAGEYTGRVRHYHFKVRAQGKPELTTQLILPAKPGDALTFDTDDIAEGLPDCQLLHVDETATPAKATFDFRV